MDVALTVVASFVGLGVGVWVGLKWGMRLSARPSWMYWAANFAMVIAGVTISIAGPLLGVIWLGVSGVGVMAGGITGLKYGYGSSAGVWAVHDRLMRVGEPKRKDGAGR